MSSHAGHSLFVASAASCIYEPIQNCCNAWNWSKILVVAYWCVWARSGCSPLLTFPGTLFAPGTRYHRIRYWSTVPYCRHCGKMKCDLVNEIYVSRTRVHRNHTNCENLRLNLADSAGGTLQKYPWGLQQTGPMLRQDRDEYYRPSLPSLSSLW